jgi:exopolysaccharide biosynthesis protein
MVFVFVFGGAAFAYPYHVGIMHNDRLFVPLRGVVEELGGNVDWDGDNRRITIQSGELKIILTIDSTEALVSGSPVKLDDPPWIKDGRTYIPLRFVSERLGARVDWDNTERKATIVKDGKTVVVRPAGRNVVGVDRSGNVSSGIKHYTKKLGNITANIVEIPPGRVRAGIVLGQNHIGGVEELGSMAARSGAVAAINGTFFEAYGGRPEPWNTLIKDGRVIHVGNTGTTVGITATGQVKMAPLRIRIEGATNGSYSWPDNWYAYGFNRTPSENGVYIYTRERGSSLGFNAGISVVVNNGRVVDKVHGQDVSIPSNGFVINFTGSEKYLAERFDVGETVDYRVIFENTGQESWHDVVTAVGAGPRLVTDGQVTVSPVEEGFTEPKILELATARSAIGVKRDGTVMLVTVPRATIHQLARLMQEAGAYNAMNLDGGASSGLWLNGKYITKPGRKLSNILVFY